MHGGHVGMCGAMWVCVKPCEAVCCCEAVSYDAMLCQVSRDAERTERGFEAEILMVQAELDGVGSELLTAGVVIQELRNESSEASEEYTTAMQTLERHKGELEMEMAVLLEESAAREARREAKEVRLQEVVEEAERQGSTLKAELEAVMLQLEEARSQAAEEGSRGREAARQVDLLGADLAVLQELAPDRNPTLNLKPKPKPKP